MATEESKLEDLFEGVYLLVLVDQYDEGLWGRFITPETKEPYVSPEETQISKRQQRAESITVTFFAADAIYTFTKDPVNRYVEKALRCLPNHEENGGYGSFGGLISSYPVYKYQIIINCRHTATALLMHLLFQDRIDEKIVRGIKFLIKHTNKDGGWGITADPTKEDSECITTTYILKLLDTVKKMGIKNRFSKNYSLKLDVTIKKGLEWLEQNNKQNDGLWVFPEQEHMKVRDSAGILATFYELKNYKKELYEKTLHRIASLQKNDGGWPLSLKGRSEIKSTVWVIHTLVNSKQDKYKNSIEKGISFIIRNISKKSYKKTLTSIEWAMILKLSGYKNIHISHESDDKIQNWANTINNEVFKSGDINFVRKKLPKQFRIVEEPILGVLEKHRPNMHPQKIDEVLSHVSMLPGMREDLRWIEVKTDIIIEYVQGIETSCNRIIHDLEESGVKLREGDKEELKTLADDLRKANKEQLTNFTNELIKSLKDQKLQKEIETKAPKKSKSIVKKTFYKITYTLNELSIALSAAITAEALLPHIEAIMHQITILNGINPALVSTLILMPLIALKVKTVK